MSEYQLQIDGRVGLSDYSNIYDYMGFVSVNDNFTIILEESDKENAEIIESLLANCNFSIASKGGTEDGRYYITALRNK
ncbi:MAG: hypothetical protein Q8936_17430 [Bacillota bacterium]|nr:hypothetical protein [Bacillota bacterium]